MIHQKKQRRHCKHSPSVSHTKPTDGTKARRTSKDFNYFNGPLCFNPMGNNMAPYIHHMALQLENKNATYLIINTYIHFYIYIFEVSKSLSDHQGILSHLGSMTMHDDSFMGRHPFWWNQKMKEFQPWDVTNLLSMDENDTSAPHLPLPSNTSTEKNPINRVAYTRLKVLWN